MRPIETTTDASSFPPWDQALAELKARINNLSERMSREGKSGRESRALAFFQQALDLHALQTEALDIATFRSLESQESVKETLPAPFLRQYVVSTIFLADCCAYLTQGRAEWLHAVTGVRLGSCFYTLDRMIPLDLIVQSAARATADPAAVFQAIRNLADSGHVLHAVFHSHRMRGVPGPSSIDRELQHRLDRGGYPAIQAIFSDDGFVRFFAGEKPFEIKIYGTGAEKINERVYKLTDRR
jgi:hypothetical protein